MNGFSKASKNGNSLVDCFNEPDRYLEKEKQVQDYIDDRDLPEVEKENLWTEFNNKGYVKL